MRKGLKDAEIAADAAKTSADALMKAQRAYVRLSHVRGASVLISGRSASINIQLQAQNWGETPARISAIAMNAIFSAPNILLPTTPPYSAAEERDAFLFRKEEFFDTWTIPVNVTDASAVLSGTLSLYLVGYIDYIDAFDVRRRGGYAREYNGSPPAANNLNLVTQAGYNYDLPRDRSQGIDWNRKI